MALTSIAMNPTSNVNDAPPACVCFCACMTAAGETIPKLSLPYTLFISCITVRTSLQNKASRCLLLHTFLYLSFRTQSEILFEYLLVLVLSIVSSNVLQ